MRFTCALLCLLPLAGAVADDGFIYFHAERIEHRFDDDATLFDAELRHTNATRSWLLELEGSQPRRGASEREFTLLYARPWTAYFDWQLGLQAATHDGDSATALVVGVAGEAPYRIETQLRAIIDDGGDVTLQGEFERDFRVSPRFVVQPRVELRIGRGNDELGGELRGRFEISPQIAPYVGIAWQHRFDGADRTDRTAVAGVSFWF